VDSDWRGNDGKSKRGLQGYSNCFRLPNFPGKGRSFLGRGRFFVVVQIRDRKYAAISLAEQSVRFRQIRAWLIAGFEQYPYIPFSSVINPDEPRDFC
jgi:hypothetical protein